MSVRQSRLQSEYQAMKKFRSQVMSWKTVGTNQPPDEYIITYNLKTITGFSNKKPNYRTGSHEVHIKFPPNYPREAPSVLVVSKPRPFHPNIWKDDGRVCLEGTQHWIPGIGVSLDSICQMVGEIIAFQEVYLESPANNDRILMEWVETTLNFESIARVSNPVDKSQIRLPDVEDAIRWGENNTKSKSRIKFSQ